jgi:CheY-like chemotaxis protein
MYLYLIDDDPLQHTLVKFHLKNKEAVSRQDYFLDASVALTQLSDNLEDEHNLPDLILLDLNMPVMDGWGFLYRFVELIPGLKKEIDIYIVSSSVNELEISKSLSFSCIKGFYTKPLMPADVITILNLKATS